MPDGTIIESSKGTLQGGILSPILYNIVLNELDWWISSQWENMPIKNKYSCGINRKGVLIKSNEYRALRRSNLKDEYKYVNLYNSTIWGIHNYYQYATDINEDCNNILKIRLGKRLSKYGRMENV